MSSKFDEMEDARKEFLKELNKLSTLEFDLEKWEKLKELVYDPQPLDVDVVIDDTTLREGLQMPGILSPPPAEACRIASLLRDIGVERIEVLTYTKSDKEGIKRMRDEGLEDIIAGWCRASQKDIDSALKLGFKQIGVSHPVSFIHFEKWPDKSVKQLTDRVVDAVEYAVDHGLRVFVHGEDSMRAEWKFEKEFINAIAEAGAEVYRICDTVGCGVPNPDAPLPYGIQTKVKHIKEETDIPSIEFHGHDDLGNAVNNTTTAIEAASGLFDKVYASTTFAGIGDRCGNAETEKIMMNCYMHNNVKKWDLGGFKELADFLASALNYHLPVDKAIIGEGAFAHESGIHVHGVYTLPLTYEVFPPELVGQKRGIRIGKRSGRYTVKAKLEEILRSEVDKEDPRFKKLTKRIKNEFVKGERRAPLKDKEFKEWAREAGFEC
ncbi:hypothetical protein AKJ48_02000 [candidate division MSBL1 archaeon SCGC-AAA261O19]|uniref:Pyruvate carboxyltransferase domain-containing protein n=1 Tax=candidate division MSBL1 archaeon SCGC-AAA261O19 TaxID=1698277 RepID=A0A133VDV3_9EURY|nr:hypothetical protein AKJ48_02000 [candidate division MSBL1 archaeon SCGC-AAA261O19]